MRELLPEPFHYDYMCTAMFVSVLIGATCGVLSGFVTLKGWSLMGDALSHAVVPGVALAWLAGVPFAIGAFVSGLLAAAGMGFIKTKTRLREDAIIGVVFTTFFAFGMLLISLNSTGVRLDTIFLGDILAVTEGDALQIVVISVVTLLVLAVKLKDLTLFCFDPAHARSLGLNVTALHFTLLTLLAATAVAALQAVGACLVVATLVTPGATAHLLTDRFPRLLALACAIGAVTGFFGAYVSYYLDGSTGGCIVVLQTAVFLVALVFAPRHGMLAARARRKKSLMQPSRPA
ncbi:MAG: metal ABC transporter permease [Puniceicoccales bacterium]|nr:metal ABC transporter permease [Puniceicoccales bacterium]